VKKYNAANERIKREYFVYLKQAQGQSEASVDAAAKALARFEEHSRLKDFKAFRYQQAVAFKSHLADQLGRRSGQKLSKATLRSTLAGLKRFFQWLSREPGYRSLVSYTDAEYFNLSDKDMRVANARREKPVPTIEQIKHVIANMPADTVLARRNRALIAFTLLTGARDSAIASFRMKHLDIKASSVFQDARDVRTKFSKTFTTTFFPVGEDVFAIFEDWYRELVEVHLWASEDPLFPKTEVVVGANNQFVAAGISRQCWSSAAPIRDIFRSAFEGAGLSYFNPHSVRNTLVMHGERVCRTPEEFKAWSQNLGHEKVMTTFSSYGSVESARQAAILRGLAAPQLTLQPGVSELAKALLQEMRVSGIASI